MDRLASHCRHCRFYTPEGRRGGHCGQLGVNVSGSWQSCDLSLSAFAPSWEVSEVFPTNRHTRIGTAHFSAPKLADAQMTAMNTDTEPAMADSTSGGVATLNSQLAELVKTDR